MKVLLVEDDDRIASEVEHALVEAGYLVDRTADGQEAWFKGDVEDYDAVILDLGLPSMDGLAVLKHWRANDRTCPVLILTARGSWAERVDGIDAGADDYLPKPFQMPELMARLRAITRRATGRTQPVIKIGPVMLDPRTMKVDVGGRNPNLSAQEYRLLAYLMHHAGRVVSQAELIEHLYPGDSDTTENTIEVMVGRVRRKLGANIILTRRGFGYVVEDEAK
ncbi:response regulator transcription factor [Kordiimonas marina]|uniref:response regulator transcription factor n=1 Tax=Kordiimonas marina TaxID=2872312 RepID=UPI001FF62DE4|nr:response regulator transcription factor [Kordiimonas marina]MCJ9428853.1 response regulator transcription factor [Kordiimonas marina]